MRRWQGGMGSRKDIGKRKKEKGIARHAELIALVLVLWCVPAAPARAQNTFGQVNVKGSPTVFVTDRSGQESQGRLITLSPAAITIKMGTGTKTFSPDQVSLIERKGDSLKNGTLVGAVVGLG